MTNGQQRIDWIFATLRESAWAPFSVLMFYLLGRSLRLYDLFPPLDIPTHFIGGIASSHFYWSAIRNSQGFVGVIPTSIQILLAFTCTGPTVLLWKFYENLFDFFRHSYGARSGGHHPGYVFGFAGRAGLVSLLPASLIQSLQVRFVYLYELAS